jgi:hypothetical protein
MKAIGREWAPVPETPEIDRKQPQSVGIERSTRKGRNPAQQAGQRPFGSFA